MHYKEFKKNLASDNVTESVEKTVNDIIPHRIACFDFISHRTGLLFGNVQSGKTSQTLGIIASAADHNFEVFIFLTTDSTHLQEQTFRRALTYLPTFCVCGEQDDVRFSANKMKKPVVLVLKKNSKVLETWKNNLISSKFLQGRPVFIVDDEGDAASLNTRINENTSQTSTINQKIHSIRKQANSSFYLQVTATPQSLFLQEKDSGHQPEFVHYFKPGSGYLGGNFFYSTGEPYSEKQVPFAIKFTDEEELSELKESEVHIPEGMQKAIASFLISAAHIHISETRPSCNFLVHPSVSISDHETIAERIGEALNNLLESIRDNDSFKRALLEEWKDLRQSKPDITDFEECYKKISSILENKSINICTMNSKNSLENIDFEQGTNIVIGGHSLGRGVTFPNLQTTYYCRKSKKPQADTFWQHSRAFGYDRDQGLIRMFLPPSLFKLFSELNSTNNAIIDYIDKNGAEKLKLTYPKDVKPTRQNVVNKEKLEIIAGDVNHFTSFPISSNTGELDDILNQFSEEEQYHTVNIETLKNIIKLCGSEVDEEWPSEKYLECIETLEEKKLREAILIVRRNRDIKKYFTAVLSPDDRKLGDQLKDTVVLTMYRIKGNPDKGWDGNPLWIPNIKFPKDNFFYSMGN